jgi:hypothetical protein
VIFVRSEAIALLAWLLTVPWLIPSDRAISTSDNPS